MPQDLNPPQISEAQARRTGGIVFVVGACLQGLFFLAFIFVILLVIYLFEGPDLDANHTVNGFLDSLYKQRSIVFAAITACLVLVGAAWPIGRWAGRSIGIYKRKFGWIGLGAAVIPAFVGSLVFCLLAIYLDSKLQESADRDFTNGFIVPVMGYAGVLFLPGALTNILSALVVRQRLRVLEEKAVQQQKLEANET